MDPLSITASIITVIGAASVIGQGLGRFASLRRAPKILLALNDEVASLYCIVQAVDFLIRQHHEITHAGPIKNLCRALEKTQLTLSILEHLLSTRFTVKDRNGSIRLDRSVWFMHSSKVEEIKEQVRADRVDLASALSLLASSASLGVELQLQQLSFTIQTLGDRVHLMGSLPDQVRELVILQKQTMISDSAQNGTSTYKWNQNKSNETDDEPDGIYADLVAAQVDKGATMTKLPHHSPFGSQEGPGKSLSRQSTLVNNDRPPSQQLNKVQTFPTPLGQSACTLDCNCACHRRNRLNSPDLLSTVFGSLFVGYKASPCDKRQCKSQSTKITYAFPQWLLRRTIALSMSYSHPQGPDLCLRLVRNCGSDADIFIAVFRGATDHVQRLIHDGKASVIDVDPGGNTALHWAVRRMDFPTIELLINAGSDLFYENKAGSFPYSAAWEKILGEPNKWKKDDLALLECLFSDRSHLSYFHFSRLHQACLGLTYESLEHVLSLTPDAAVDVLDNTRRTTLSWAAQRGDINAVEKLLQRRASPNRQDDSLRTPLHWSVSADTEDCLQLLLQKGAKVDYKDDWGRTALSIVASKKDEPSFMQCLIASGANIHIEDDEGWQALHWAAHKNQASIVKHLLQNQASGEATDKLGRCPLHVALLRNSHKSMQVLVDHNACGKPGRTALGSTILHSAAYYGDIESLEILTSADLGNIGINETNNEWLTAQTIADRRRDDNEAWADLTLQPCDEDPLEWYKAFENLIKHLIEEQARSTIDSSDETWLLVQTTSGIDDGLDCVVEAEEDRPTELQT